MPLPRVEILRRYRVLKVRYDSSLSFRLRQCNTLRGRPFSIISPRIIHALIMIAPVSLVNRHDRGKIHNPNGLNRKWPRGRAACFSPLLARSHTDRLALNQERRCRPNGARRLTRFLHPARRTALRLGRGGAPQATISAREENYLLDRLFPVAEIDDRSEVVH